MPVFLKRNLSSIESFLRMESIGGVLLVAAAVLAIVLANSPLEVWYQLLLSVPVAVSVGDFDVSKPLLLWINDGLMAVFFFLVGLELKRELIEGELAQPRKIILPGVGAIGGMSVPALIYLYFNWNDPVAVQGWAIPAATDIAFALGVLSLLGSRVPVTVKVFLTSLAIFDDVGAILIIAFFYTANISLSALWVLAACLLVLLCLNRANVVSKSPYILIGIIAWTATLKSGVHATLAGVLLAMFIPIRCKIDPAYSPLKSMEHDLHSIVTFFVLPVFAFANAGLRLSDVSIEQLLHGVPVGIALGLFLGNQIGVFGLCYLCVKMKLATLPEGMDWRVLYGTALLCGIGFTMSLFIGSLAFEETGAFGETGVNLLFDERLGIVIGSLLSGLAGYLVLDRSLGRGAASSTAASIAAKSQV